MFELESKDPNKVTIITKTTTVSFDVAESKVDAKLAVGEIVGPGEFEIGDVSVRAIAVGEKKTIYDAEIAGVHVGIIGGVEEGLDDLGMADVLCTSSVRAVREIEPKMVVAMGNVDGMISELKLTARTEKRVKIKNADSLPTTMEVVALI